MSGTSERLQRALLPDQPTEVNGLHIATRYAPSDANAEIGGDFYDAFQIDDDHVALVIGDVEGHSLHAASIMGDLRGALRAYCAEGSDPATVVARANMLFERFSPGMTATVWCSVLELSTGRLSVANAGHLPALVLTESAAWWFAGGCTLMGVQGTPPSTTVFELPASATLVCATDGLVERPMRSIDVGLDRMLTTARGVKWSAVELLAETLLESGRADVSNHTDDVALLVVHLAEFGADRSVPQVAEGTQMHIEPAS